MTNYPPGTTRRDLERAGIITHPVDCVECDATINAGDAHEDWCELDELSVGELRELMEEEAQHTEYCPVEHNND